MTGNGKRGAAAAMSAFLMAGLAVGCASGEAADSGPAGGGAPERGVGAADPGWQPANQEPAGEDAVGQVIEGAEVFQNDWVEVGQEPVSTFGADVDTASYTMVRFLLNNGGWYEGMSEHARIEEMVNYFDYDYPAPPADSDRPFNVDVKVGAAPWKADHQLARIGVKAKDVRPNPKGNNIVLLVDTSGSMSDPGKLPLLVESFKLLAEKFDHQDRISLVTYAGSSSVVLDGVTGSEGGKISAALDSLVSGGSTAGAEGLATAYELAREHFIEGGNNRVMLATDGDFNVGPYTVEDLTKQIIEARESGVFISVLGFGIHSHDQMMEAIADNGNGNYFYIDRLAEARRALVDQFDSTVFTVAKDLKLQVEFNPATVARYRLIGYENRVLANEDFADDTVDAGDVGAGATVTALYELVPGQAEGDAAAGEADTWLTVSTRYKPPDGDQSVQDDFTAKKGAADVAADADWRFAAAVAEFGLILRDSEHRGDASLAQVQSLAKGALGKDPYGLRAEFYELVETYAELQG